MAKKVLIKQFKNKKKESIAGLTPEHAVYDANGVRLDAKLGNVNLQEFRNLQQQGVNAIKSQETKSIQAVAAREQEVLTKTDASLVSSNTADLEGSNVQANLNDASNKLTELGRNVAQLRFNFAVVGDDTFKVYVLPFVIKQGMLIKNNGVRIGCLPESGATGEFYINSGQTKICTQDTYRVRTLSDTGEINIEVSKMIETKDIVNGAITPEKLSVEYAKKDYVDNQIISAEPAIGTTYADLVGNTSAYEYYNIRLIKGNTYKIINTTGIYQDIYADRNGEASRKIATIDIIEGEQTFVFKEDALMIRVYGNGAVIVKLDKVFDEHKIEFVTITANSDANSDADFKGKYAIRNAIHSITDASKQKQYIIKCSGNFIASKPSDYEAGSVVEGADKFALFWLKPYIHLDGIDSNNCVIRAELPDSLSECQADKPSFVKADYGMYQPLHCGWYSHNISNITFVASNTRYPLHIDAGVETSDKEINITNCRLIHEGKRGDAVGTTGGSSSGFGTSSGCKYTFKNCYFRGLLQPYYHDNHNFKDKSIMIFEDCDFVQVGTPTIANGIALSSLENLTGSSIVFKNCNFPNYCWVAIYDESSTKDKADTLHIEMNCDTYPMPIYNHAPAIGLRITATVEDSYITVDSTSSAFDLIFGYSNEPAKFINKNMLSQVYGYEYKNGNIGIAGFVIGLRNLAFKSMGARLGDCSNSPKQLKLNVNGSQKIITFNENYIQRDNDYVLNVINNALSGVATADLYKVNMDWYPHFKGVETVKVEDATSILVGMGVVYTATGVKKATKNDTKIDGIALDSGGNGSLIRIITKGALCYNLSATWRYGVRHNGPSYHGSVVYGTKYGIGDTDGVFSPNAINPTIRKGFDESWVIL